MLRIHNLALTLDGHLLFSHFALRVSAGEWVCLSGESGCGKTSLLRSIQGFVPVQEGDVVVGGTGLSARTVERVRRQVAYMPQDLHSACGWVNEMAMLPFSFKANRATVCSRERLMTVWEQLGLDSELYDQRMEKLSGGQRQRVLLATAVLLNKPLLLLDEPTAALDEENALRAAALLRRQADEGHALVVVSHDARLLAACDRVITL